MYSYTYVHATKREKTKNKSNVALSQSSTRAPDARAAPGHAERHGDHGEKHQKSPGRELGRKRK